MLPPMSACPQCGTVAKPTDKFCNVCGNPIAAAPAAPQGGFAPPGQQGYAPPPQAPPGQPGYGVPAPQQGFGAPPPAPGYGAPGGAPSARCQMGHDIAPGASYCAQGHPIGLDQMQFAGGGQAAFGAPPGPPGFGAPPQAPASPYGAPPAPPQQAFGAPPQQGFPPPQPAFGAPPQAPAFGAPPPQPGYAPGPPGGFGGQPQGQYAPPPAPPQAPPFGAPGVNDTSRDAAPGKVLRGFLVSYVTNASGDFWPLNGGRLTVGRLAQAEGIDITLQDPTISSRHAALVIDAHSGSISVEDTGSTNGTFVNDEHIGFNGRRELRDGDRVRFGGYNTVVKVIGRV
jgi:hypothetical protein